ncbi:MAG: asparagine synthase B, partial [Treponemataceae bacterium]|nr:asparagine synthase B [Treponemataceae bacterium]
MCGFVGAFDLESGSVPLADGLREELRSRVLEMSRRIRHRGPDWSGVYTGDNAILSHERLAIVDPLSGKQPLVSDDETIILAVNGEIYNQKEIRARFSGKYNFKTQSDCEVIIPLYKEAIESFGEGVPQDLEKRISDFIESLSGIFAFALYDSTRDLYLVSRDEIGVIPLYQGWDSDGRYYVASELKALEGNCVSVEEFPNGSFYLGGKGAQKFFASNGGGKPIRWYSRSWEKFENVKDNKSSVDELRAALETSVKKQLMSDVPYGVLLSGGLDSSIIAAITKKFAARRIESGDTQAAWWPTLHSFAIGLEGS